MTPSLSSFLARSKSSARSTLKNASGCFSINSSALAIAATASSKFPCAPPSVDFTTFTPEPTINLVTPTGPTGSSVEIGNPISPSTSPSITSTLRYNSAAVGVMVAVALLDHKASGLIAVNVTAPPKVFANFRRLIIYRSDRVQKLAAQSVRSYVLLLGCVGTNAENVVMAIHPAVVRDCIAVHTRRQDHACAQLACGKQNSRALASSAAC